MAGVDLLDRLHTRPADDAEGSNSSNSCLAYISWRHTVLLIQGPPCVHGVD
jgi:hypothetical protein